MGKEIKLKGRKNTKTNRIGEEVKTVCGKTCRIINYRRADDLDVLIIEDNYVKYNQNYRNFKNGIIKSPFDKTIYGVGSIGLGDAPITIPIDNNKRISHPAYSLWTNMLKRCYDKKTEGYNPTYKGCSVCEDWLCYNNFYKWYNENYYEIEGEETQLDKDILFKNNKVYSPDTCIFVPQSINLAFIRKTDKHRGSYPTGVYINSARNRYISYITIYSKTIHLGTFDTIEEAFNEYKEAKEGYLKDLADKYKNIIPKKLYNALINYEVTIE